jgi:hypothetical protein
LPPSPANTAATGPLLAHELDKAQALVEQKFATPQWTATVP